MLTLIGLNSSSSKPNIPVPDESVIVSLKISFSNRRNDKYDSVKKLPEPAAGSRKVLMPFYLVRPLVIELSFTIFSRHSLFKIISKLI